MQRKHFLIAVAPIYRMALFLPFLIGLVGVTIFVHMAIRYQAAVPIEFIVVGGLAVLCSLVQITFEKQRIEISWFGIPIKRWTGHRLTTRPEKKYHRVFKKNDKDGNLKVVPLLLNFVPDPLIEWKKEE